LGFVLLRAATENSGSERTEGHYPHH